MSNLSPTTRQIFPLFAILALLALGKPAAARLLEPAPTLEGFPFTTAYSVAMTQDGRHLYAGGSDNFVLYPTPGLAWLRRDPADGSLTLERSYFTESGDGVFGVALGRDDHFLLVLRERALESYRRGGDGSLALSHSVALPGGFSPQAIRRLPQGDLLVKSTNDHAIYRLDANGVPIYRQRLEGASLDLQATALDGNTFVSGSTVATFQGGAWSWQPLSAYTSAVTRANRHTLASADGRYLYVPASTGTPPYTLRQLVTLERVGGQLIERGRTGYPEDSDLEVTATALHPTTGHLYIANINTNGGNGGTIHHYRPVGGGASFAWADSTTDPSKEIGGRTAKDSLTFSADGRHLYATFAGEPMALFAVDPGTGELEHRPDAAGPLSRFERPFKLLTGDPDEIYALAPNAVIHARWDGGTSFTAHSSLVLDGWATYPHDRRQVVDLVLTPGGGAGVLAAPRDLAMIERDRQTGALRIRTETSVQLENEIRQLAISPDGRYVYVVTSGALRVYYLRRDQINKLVLMQTFPIGGQLLRLSDNGTEAMLIRSGQPPLLLRRAADSGQLTEQPFHYEGLANLAQVRDARFTAGGRVLYLFRSGLAERLVRTAAGRWAGEGAGSFASERPALHALDAAGLAVFTAGETALWQSGLTNHSSYFQLQSLGSLPGAGADLGDFGFDFTAAQLVVLLPGEAELAVADPTGGRVSLVRRGCGDLLESGPCLAGGRFRAEVAWRDPAGVPWPAEPLRYGSDNAQVLSFFDTGNWEMMVKVLDGCAINGRFWLYAAASTDVAFDLRLTDTWTGATRLYASPAGPPAPAITDGEAFATCGAADPGWTTDPPERASLQQRPALLLSGSYEVEVAWTDHQGQRGNATGLQPAAGAPSGLFYFFTPDNWEMQVKVLDGCAINGHYWVLGAATTDVGYTVRVRSRLAGTTKTYTNPVGRASPAIIDIQAFACN